MKKKLKRNNMFGTDITIQDVKKSVKVPLVIKVIRVGFQIFGNIFPRATAKFFFFQFSMPRKRAKHKRMDELIKSAKPFDFFHNGEKLIGYQWGRGEKAVLLLHGWESRGTAMRSFVPGLLKKGYKVLTMDAPAHGNSGGKRTNIMNYAYAVETFLKKHNDVKAIIGHSFGSAAATYYSANLAENNDIKKLVLIGIPADMDTIIKEASAFLKIPDKVIPAFKELIEKKLGSKLEEINMENMLPRLQNRDIFVIHDIKDEVVSISYVDKIMKKCKRITFLKTEGLGHFRVLKNDDVIGKVIDFIGD